MHLLKQTETMQTEVRVNYLNCHIHVPSNHVLANREANSRHTYDVTIWLSRTTDNSNIFIRSREVRDNESRLYLFRSPILDPLINNAPNYQLYIWCFLLNPRYYMNFCNLRRGIFVLFDLGLMSLSTSFSYITTVSGCGRELNAHF